MAIDLIRETVAKGYSLLLDESAIRNTKFINFLIASKSSFPPHSIVLLRSVANNVSGMTLRNGFLDIPQANNPLILVGYDKPAGSALLERGSSKKLAIITADSTKAQSYAAVDTPIPHLTVLVDSDAHFVLVERPKPQQPKPAPGPTSPKPQPTNQVGPEYPECIKPNFVFDYYGGKKDTPPDLGKKVDVACPPSGDDEVGAIFVGATGKKYRLTVPKGQGGSARVYLCDDPTVVVKRFLNDQLYETEQEKIRYMAEHAINHPHAIWPLDMVSKQGKSKTLKNIGYVMASCPYPDLDETSKKPADMQKRFGSKEYLILAIVQLLDAFECMQQANIVNGDIKLLNCAYNDQTHMAYVVDLDAVQVGKYINRMASTFYVPPEDWAKFKTHNNSWRYYREKSSDNYAIAVMLFYLLVGLFPYSSCHVNGANEEEAKAAAVRGDFPYRGNNKEIQHLVHRTGYIRWTHLPSFIRQAFIDVFQKGGKHFAPKDRLTPGQWKKLFVSYLRMIRDPKSKLAMADKDHYLDVAPLLAKNKKGTCELDLKVLDIQPVQEVDARARGVSLEAAVTSLLKKTGINLDARTVTQGLLAGRGTFQSGTAAFELKVCVPFLKVVTVHATVSN